MAKTFQDILASEATGVFLNADEFGVTILHTSPDGTTAEIAGVVDFDLLDQGQPEATTPKGTRIHQRALLEVAATVAVAEERPGGQYGSLFVIDDLVWLAKRIVGKDSATQTVEIHRVDQKATKRV